MSAATKPVVCIPRQRGESFFDATPEPRLRLTRRGKVVLGALVVALAIAALWALGPEATPTTCLVGVA